MYKVGNTLPKELVATFEPYTNKRWNELGRPLCAIQRSKRNADGTHVFSLAKFLCGGPGAFETSWITEDIPNERAWDGPVRIIGDGIAERGAIMITPFPDTDPIHKLSIMDGGAKKDEPVKQEDGAKKNEPVVIKEEDGAKKDEPVVIKEEDGAKKNEPVVIKEEDGAKKDEPVVIKEEDGAKKDEPDKQEDGPVKQEEPEVIVIDD